MVPIRYALAGALLSACLLPAALAADPKGVPGIGGAAAPREAARLLASACLDCHGSSSKQGGLDLTRRSEALKAGPRGAAVVPGRPAQSRLWQRVEAGEMPPGKPLPPAERALLKRWIEEGAAWETDPLDPLRYSSESRAGYDWWSLQPIREVAPPEVRRPGWIVNPIDNFVLERLEKADLSPSRHADRVTLARRLYFDLIGLPPTPLEIDEFLGDSRPGAYERLVDRLLESPHYGERWARHWLDIIRFGESQGFERNKLRPSAWKYRDWVVEALNSDLPYNEFIRMQMAGDLLKPQDPEALIASGFLVMGPYDQTAYLNVSAMMKAAAREEEVEGLVGTVTQTVLGLTANCARCHDHKFDPISQREYYQLAASLSGIYHGAERDVAKPDHLETVQRLAALASEANVLNRALAELDAGAADADLQRRRLTARLSRITAHRRLLEPGKAHFPEPKDPGVVHVLARGDFREKRESVAPAGIRAVTGAPAAWGLAQDAPEADRRLALTRWSTDPANPLTPRVIVNRLWGYHFGAGLVPTPSDFGLNGGTPSHPELLDWLARELTRRNWSLKQMHRLMVTSNSYRQSSAPSKAALARDADNRLLWRYPPRRLDAEALRDAVLAVAGELDLSMGGPGFRDWKQDTQGENEVYALIDAEGPEFNRRTIYRTVVRAGSSPFLDSFDCPDPSVSTPRRSATTTPLQALTLLNSSFMMRSSKKWAARLVRDSPHSVEDQVKAAYRAAYGRPADPAEAEYGSAFARAHGLHQFCLVLLNTNEFLYID